MIPAAMGFYSFIRRSLLIALVCAAPFFILGWLIVTRADGGWEAVGPVLFGMFLLIVGAVIVAPSIAEWIAEPAGSLYTPSGQADYSTPMYGIADALRAKGNYEDALDYLHHIVHTNPRELDAYVRMIDIAVVDLHDLARAEALYHRGTHAMGNDGDKAALTVMYQALASRYKDPAHPTPARPIALPSRFHGPVPPHRVPPAPPATDR
jgi:hypothetical protein